MLQVLLPWGGCLLEVVGGCGGRWAPLDAAAAGVVWRGLVEWRLLLAALAGCCVQEGDGHLEEHSTSGFLMTVSTMASMSINTSFTIMFVLIGRCQ